MDRILTSAVVSLCLVALSATAGVAFQLLGAGSQAGTPNHTATVADQKAPDVTGAPTLKLGDNSSNKAADGKSSMDIWIPGLGVVGKMPKLNFGLDMLYGDNGIADAPPLYKFEDSESDPEFAIKGTIKRKF